MQSTASLPTGTATFLFTDIEGSTALLQRLGTARFTSLLERHHQILREAIGAHGGVIPRTEGDAFFAVFPAARPAVMAAIEAQRALVAQPWPADGVVRVRMGLHTGEATLGGDEYVGLDVHRAARIASAAHGGQILVSAATQALTWGALPEGIGLHDLGEHSFKDLGRPERVYQVVADGLPSEFPGIRSLSARATRHHLPPQLTSFVGRERELAQARQLLAEARLLTLTGPGGTGKTRLAVELAATLADRFPDGVYFVSLAPLTGPELVPSALVHALGLQDAGSWTPREHVLNFVQDKRLLLVLDNFEHLLPAAAFVKDLLHAGSDLKALVTSRSPLTVEGEREYPVPTLRLPDANHLPADPAALLEYEGVRLFVERAVAAKPDFRLTTANAGALAKLCVGLDGLPLAIELAAARVRVLTVEQIAQRLDDRFRLLTAGSRTAPSRHQTVAATIDWSYDMLAPSERVVFRRLAVFAGGWTLEAAERVCSGEAIASLEVLDLLAGLVEKSLVVAEERRGASRYRFLETLRAYAAMRLRQSDEEEGVRKRHRDWCLDLAQRAEVELQRVHQSEWLECLQDEQDNLRAVLDWAHHGGDATTGLRLSAALWRFWWLRGHLSEGRQWLTRFLEMAESSAPPAARAKALNAHGVLAFRQGDYGTARASLEQYVRLARELGDRQGLAAGLRSLGRMAIDQGALAEARTLLDESITLEQALGSPQGVGWSLNYLGLLAHFERDNPTARRLLQESLALLSDAGDLFGTAVARYYLGRVAFDAGSRSEAHALWRTCIET